MVLRHSSQSLLLSSAGVGRTGVFIALTNLIERLKTEAVVDVYQTVKKLRQQRTAMVQTKVRFCSKLLICCDILLGTVIIPQTLDLSKIALGLTLVWQKAKADGTKK